MATEQKGKELALLEPRLRVERRSDGLVLHAATPLPPSLSVTTVGHWLRRWAEERPTQPFLAERPTDQSLPWRELSYAEALRAVEGLGSALLALGASPTRPVMILADNDIDSALLALAAMHIGVPAAPVSSAYALQSHSWARLRALAAQLRPGFVYVPPDSRYAGALNAVQQAVGDVIALHRDRPLASLMATEPSAEQARAFAATGPHTVAKILFTSGSTGAPRGVVNTQRMLTSNQESLAACWPFLQERPPVVVDWLPWSHTFGGNHNFFLVLRAGGTLYIDRGRPVPGLIDVTVANLAAVSPTLWFNVPRGFDQAAPILERDRDLAARVFANLDLVFYAAAALSATTRARLEAVAASVGRSELFFTSAWGSTETAPLATAAHFATRTTGILGVPVPGVSLKLARGSAEERYELRVKGPNVTPGYWQPGGAIVPVALDDEGYLPTGDAGELVDADHPESGVRFAGRLSENFKLSSGTWVQVAEVRLALVDACAPLVLDAVIAGQDHAELGALLFLSAAGAALTESDLDAALRESLARYNRAHPGNSQRIARLLALRTPLSLDDGETTDKGYTNQRRVLERRADDVARLFAGAGISAPAHV